MKDILQIIAIMDLMVLEFFGVLYFLNRSIARKSRSSTFLAIIGSFVQLVQFLWIGAGLADCLFQIRHKN